MILPPELQPSGTILDARDDLLDASTPVAMVFLRKLSPLLNTFDPPGIVAREIDAQGRNWISP